MPIIFVLVTLYVFLAIGTFALKAENETVLLKSKGWRITLLIAWYDIWAGVYIAPGKNTVFIGIPFIYLKVLKYHKMKPLTKYKLEKALAETQN